jgi:Holliday junction resolvase
MGPSRRTAISGLRPRLIAEDILLGGLADWIRNTGLGSWNQVEVRSLKRQPKFGQFRWDLSAPSFVYPVRSSRKQGPGAGFVVGDVLLGREIDTPDLGYFFEKATVMRLQPNTRPFLAIFLAERYTADALRAGRQMGLLLATTETLFGRRVAQGLTDLVNVLGNAAAAVSANPKIVAELFGRLDELKGASLNVRGWLFELVAAQILRAGGWSIQSIGELRRDPTSGEAAEVDVLATRGIEALVVECKGYVNTQVTIHDAEKWLTKSVPRLRGSLLFEKFYQSKEITYQFWTTSTLSSEAAAYLKKKKTEIKKFTFDWLEGPGVMMLSKSSKSEYTTRVLREQYQLA